MWFNSSSGNFSKWHFKATKLRGWSTLVWLKEQIQADRNSKQCLMFYLADAIIGSTLSIFAFMTTLSKQISKWLKCCKLSTVQMLWLLLTSRSNLINSQGDDFFYAICLHAWICYILNDDSRPTLGQLPVSWKSWCSEWEISLIKKCDSYASSFDGLPNAEVLRMYK